MNERNEALIRRWFEEVWNNKREEAIDEMLADDVVAFGLIDGAGREVGDKSSFKELFRAFTEVYPDLHVTVEDTMSDGDRAMARCTVTGTHTGGGLGFSATNKPVEFSGILLVEIKDDKIVKAWNEFNFVNMYLQLGALSLVEPVK